MMLPLIRNSYNLVSYYQNLMKLFFKLKNKPSKYFPIFSFFSEEKKKDFIALVDLEKFQA